jgi:hypothetical protein
MALNSKSWAIEQLYIQYAITGILTPKRPISYKFALKCSEELVHFYRFFVRDPCIICQTSLKSSFLNSANVFKYGTKVSIRTKQSVGFVGAGCFVPTSDRNAGKVSEVQSSECPLGQPATWNPKP